MKRSLHKVKLLGASGEEKRRIARAYALSGAELEELLRFFSSEGRNPTLAEMHVVSQLWSEHCRHKTFRGLIVDEKGETIVEDMLSSYIAEATRRINAPWVFSFLEDNAGIVEFAGGYGVAVKVETHNHPSAVDPFGGAATGVGGVIRDVLAVWADPVALVDVLCFGPPGSSGGLLSPERVAKGVVSGVGYYGNNVGVPTVAGAVCFHEGYSATPAVYVGCVGLLPLDRYARNPRPGDLLVLVGNKTGRDGISGASFASRKLEGSVEELRPAVQIPDPVEEEKLIRLVARVRDERLASGITDLGGGGLAVAAAETAGRAGGGCRLDLDAVPLRESMEAWEILVSESQERMLLTVPPGKLDRLLEAARREEVEASVVGKLTDTGFFEAYHRGVRVARLPVSLLLHPPRTVRVARKPGGREKDVDVPPPADMGEALLRMLSSPNVSSRESVIRTYDFEVRGNTAVKPLEEPLGGPNDAAVIKPLDGRREGVVISVGVKPRYSELSPYWMAASSLEEALRNNVAVGGRRQALLDNFVWGSPEDPETMWSLVEAARACRDFAVEFGTPFVSGKDSLYNESGRGPINPTLLITAVGIIPDVEKAVTVPFKRRGDPVYLLGVTRKELGGSEYYSALGAGGGIVPRVRPGESRRTMKCLTEAIDRGLVAAAHDLSEGGLAVALAEMVLSSGLGAEISLEPMPREGVERDDYLLFSESNGRFLVEVRREKEEEFGLLAEKHGCHHARIGVVGGRSLSVTGLGGRLLVEKSWRELLEAWRRELW